MASASSASTFASGKILIVGPGVEYTSDAILANYEYTNTEVRPEEDAKDGTTLLVAVPVTHRLKIRTERRVPKTGLMIVGLGGNNGTTVTAAIIANREKITWEDKAGLHQPDFLGSLTQASTVKLGMMNDQEVYIPFNRMLPMVDPCDLVIGGWDISKMNLADAMHRAEVLPLDLQRRLRSRMESMIPLPSIYVKDFIAANQEERADNILTGTRQEMLDTIRTNIRDFKIANGLDKVIIIWSATTERFCTLTAGVHDSAENLLKAIKADHSEVSPSTVFAVAAVLEGSSYVNGSPQNTNVPGVIELATAKGVYVGGDDFKSGQTKIKSVLVDFLVSAGLKPRCIVSYNHLGNNDGRNLSAPQQFRSKEISKASVIDDMVESNRLLYAAGETPDHCVVIKYVPFMKDSKRAMDEYTSQIFMGGYNTIVLHNTCEDSLLAAPLILDLAVITEMCERITIQPEGATSFARFHSVLSLLSYMLKAPMVPEGAPVINALFKQREALINVFRACVGLPPENHMMLEHRVAGLSNTERTCVGCISSSQDGDISVIREVVAKEQTDKAKACAVL